MRKIIICFGLFLVFLFLNFKVVYSQNKVTTLNDESPGPKLETGSVNPMYGPPGNYTFQTHLINSQGQEPDYVKIFLTSGDGKSKEFETHLMTKGTTSPQGIAYQFTKKFEEKDEGMYEFYFEAKIGGKILHNPSYGGDNCQPGLCAACCGAWGGPKVFSEKLITGNKIYLFQKEKNSPVWSFNVGTNWVTSIKFSADEKSLAAADNNQHVYFFDLSSNRPKWIFTGEVPETGDVGMDNSQVALSKNGYLAAALKGTVYLFKTDSNKPLWSYPTTMVLNGLVISDDGQYLAAAGRDTNVYFWKTDSSTPAWSHKIEAKGGLLGGSVIISMTMNADGQYFVAGTSCPDRSVHVFTPLKSEEIFQSKAGVNFPVGSVSMSNDGQYFLAGGGGDTEDPYTAILYKLGKNEPVWRFDYSRNPVSQVAISADAKLCAIGSNMDGLMMTQCANKDPVWQLKNTGYLAGLSLSKDGKFVAAGSGINEVFLLPSDGSKILNEWKIDNKVESVALSSSGNYVAAGTGLNRFIMTTGAGAGTTVISPPKLVDFKNSAGRQISTGPQIQSKSQTLLSFWSTIIPSIFFGLGLVIYLAITKIEFIRRKNQWLPAFNKTIALVLSALTVLFVILSIVFLVLSPKNKSFNGYPPAQMNTSQQNNSPGQFQKGKGGVCGNHVCESNVGETKENCPKDCSGGN